MNLKGIPNATITIIITVLILLCMCSKGSSWSWMVLSGVGNTTTKTVDSRAPPPCPSYCLNGLGGNVTAGTPVGLWWCQGTRFNNEKWSVGEGGGGLYVTDADSGTPYCLDVAPTAPFSSNSSNSSINSTNSSIYGTTPVQPTAPDGERQYYYLMVADCHAGSASQSWRLEPGSGLLRRLDPGGAGDMATYVRAYHPANAPSLYYLLLSADAASAVSFTQVDGPAALASTFRAPPPPGSADNPNAVLNGNLQFLTDYQPLAISSLDPTPLPRPQLLLGYMFILCHWSVEADVSIGSCNADYNLTCPLPPDWCPSRQNPIFLNSLQRSPPARSGRIVQTVPTLAGARYLLVFEMKNPYHYTQLVQVSLSPPPPDGSLAASAGFAMASNQTGSVWHEFRFTAAGNFVNISFSSEDSTDCGPLIDNIQMYALPDDANQSRRGGHFAQLVTLVAVGWTLAVVLMALVLTYLWIRKREAAAVRKVSEQPVERRVLVLRYEQLKEYTQDFKVLIGEGGFGKVYYGEMPDGQKIAVKRGISATGGAIVDGDEAENFRGEVELLSRVHHRYIVKFLGYSDDKGERMLVFEYLPNKSLYNHLHNVKYNNNGGWEEDQCISLSWGVRMQIAYQVAYALEYLHHGARPPVMHRDVKSANVLLTAALQARVADMGISKVGRVEDATQWTSTMTVVKGSRGYLDPHYLQTNMISEKSDVYSFGVLLLELISGRKAITPDSELLTSWARDVYYNHHIFDHHLQEMAIAIDGRHSQPAAPAAYIDDAAATAVLDPRLCGSVPASFVHAAMELARSCLHEQPRLRPSMMDIATRLRDSQLQFLAAAAVDDDDDDGACHADNARKVDVCINDVDDEGFLLRHSSTSDWRSSQSMDVSGR